MGKAGGKIKKGYALLFFCYMIYSYYNMIKFISDLL